MNPSIRQIEIIEPKTTITNGVDGILANLSQMKGSVVLLKMKTYGLH